MHLPTITVTSLSLVLLLTLLRHLLSHLRSLTFIRAHACRPARHITWTREPLLGLDFMAKCVSFSRTGFYMRFLASRFTTVGTTYLTRRLAYDTLHTADPENIKYMLATGFENYGLAKLRIDAMRPLFGEGIFTTNGGMWSHYRAVLRPSFTRGNMTPLLEMMERHWTAMRELVPFPGDMEADGGGDGDGFSGVFDIQSLFFCFTMDTATEFLMGASTHTLDPHRKSDKERQFVADYMDSLYETVRQIAFGKLQFLSRTPKGIAEKRARAWAYVDGFVDEVLSNKEKRGDVTAGTGYNFLEEIAAQTSDKTLMRNQVLGALLASRDTTAALMSNLFYLLARNPAVYAKLRREVLSKIEGELPTEAEMGNMTYLRWCINEALRMYPVVPGNTREALCDTILPVGGGSDGRSPLFVKKGTPVMYNVYAMHRRKDIYGEDADTFNPERWDGLRPGWGFLPFNGGPRVCIGRKSAHNSISTHHYSQSNSGRCQPDLSTENFALTETSYVTVRILQTFEVLESRDDSPWMEQYALVMCSRNGVQVAVKPAASSKGAVM